MNIRITLYITCVILSLGCANIKPPQGGPEDNQSAVLDRTNSTPDSLHLINFTGNTIQLLFNEKIVVQNLKSELIVTPFYPAEIKHNIKKAPKKQSILELTFEEPLRQNTTYTLNFGKSIRDLREGNITENLTFAFSTGPYIDSIKVSGTTSNQWNGQPLSAQIFLFDLSDTARLNNGKPTYVTTSNSQGKFSIDHIKSSSYSIVGLTDINNNLYYDISKEYVGFDTTTLQLDSTDITNINLTLFKESVPTFKLQSIKPKDNHFLITFNKPLSTFQIDNDSISPILSPDKKTVQLFSKQPALTHLITLSTTDSITNKIDTTFSLESILDNEFYNRENKDLIKSYTIDNQIYKDSLSLEIQLNQPLETLLESNIFLISNNDTVQLTEIANKTIKIASNKSLIQLSINHKRNDSLQILFKPKAISSTLGNSSKQYTFDFLPIDPTNYGSLGGTISTDFKYYHLYLLNSKNEIITEIKNHQTFKISLLKPDTYSFLVTVDTNQNGHWDNGQLSKSIQPEPRIFLPSKFKLKANWEIDNIELKF